MCALALLGHGQIVARQPRAEGHGMRQITGVLRQHHCAGADMEGIAAFTLQLDMAHRRIRRHHDFSDGIGQISLFAQRDIILDHAALAAFIGNDQAARIGGGALAGGYEQQMDRLFERGIFCGMDEYAVLQKRGVQCNEQIVFTMRQLRKMRFDQGGAGF